MVKPAGAQLSREISSRTPNGPSAIFNSGIPRRFTPPVANILLPCNIPIFSSKVIWTINESIAVSNSELISFPSYIFSALSLDDNTTPLLHETINNDETTSDKVIILFFISTILLYG